MNSSRSARRLIPRPLEFRSGDGEYLLDHTTEIGAPAELDRVAVWLQSVLRPATGLPLREARDVDGVGIRLDLDHDLAPEAYRLSIDERGIRIAGGDPAGVFYGCQALRQLLPPEVFRSARVERDAWTVPHVLIADAPRFGWRGVMLDVARHFLPKADLLRFIDLLAVHRLNVLHLHLTDDQGWRLQIRAFPRLTEVGGWRRESRVGVGTAAGGNGRPHGGYYTQDDIREIVAYAAERFITVVPEVETPGHVQAALAAYPALGVTGKQLDVWTRWGINPNLLNAEDATLDFFRTVFDEVMELFPSVYIGVGGDEALKEQWQRDERTQQRMAELGIADEEELQSWFIRQWDEHLTARGRRLFGWDEILEGGLAPGATVASWRGIHAAIAAANAGHDVVVCPDDRVYLDYRQSERADEPVPVGVPLGVADVYRFEPVPAELGEAAARHVLGAQANVWTEHIDSSRHMDYMVFPRLCAFAEAVWTTGERDLDDFLGRLGEHLSRLDAIGVEYRRESGPLPWQTRPGVPGRPMTREARLAQQARLVANIVGTSEHRARPDVAEALPPVRITEEECG